MTRVKYLLLNALIKTSEAWQMPQGGIDESEDPRTAALRELKEEIGTAHIKIIAESSDWLSYDLPEHLIGKLWGGKFRGQIQKWYLAKFLGNDSDINLETDHPEFTEWKWVDPHEIPNLIVPFKQKLYQDLLEEFGDLM